MRNYLMEFEDVTETRLNQMSGCMSIVMKCILKYRKALKKNNYSQVCSIFIAVILSYNRSLTRAGISLN